uniref:MYND finger domain protein, putative n=1 Tax=Babesia bovis TaxID=5865 RepID=S6CAB5_BABBO|nr:MYND finger domain protein, putative [Babesia bovis]
MDTLGSILHKEFSYVHIPCDINSPIEVLKFKGSEDSFRKHLTNQFAKDKLLADEKHGFEKYLKSQYKETQEKAGSNNQTNVELSDDLLKSSLEVASITYQIIPLTLPSKKNGYIGINCYIDGIGRVKNLPANARATKVCSTDIRGECYVSKTFDDEEEFRRMDLTLEDYNELFENPPDATGRWDSAEALSKMLDPQKSAALTQQPKKEIIPNNCENCKREESKDAPLKICSRCKKIKYCSVQCQKDDWKYHQRICNVK